METASTLPVLDPVELRVLGSLIEKSKITPEYYPMTLNALTAACNQKTSRKPVVLYDEETVVMALNSLKKAGLIATATGGTSRTVKYKHNITLVFPFTSAELAIICLLFLRGPQTAGELNTNAGRLYEFGSLEEVQGLLEKMSGGETPYVQALARRSGQKEVRYAHLFGGSVEQQEEDQAGEEPARKSVSELEARLTRVEQELAGMKEVVNKLVKELMG